MPDGRNNGAEVAAGARMADAGEAGAAGARLGADAAGDSWEALDA